MYIKTKQKGQCLECADEAKRKIIFCDKSVVCSRSCSNWIWYSDDHVDRVSNCLLVSDYANAVDALVVLVDCVRDDCHPVGSDGDNDQVNYDCPNLVELVEVHGDYLGKREEVSASPAEL
ncbi:unnamed protein product [Trichogramma brassicae]|uniref:Uncharacterized protein n=1 Tax=Trichogramma brassicae TaxID=86971 RepID=A0A6H5IQR5_9HYME|nr:unnamed protein product [Trichogramma brassicae]